MPTNTKFTIQVTRSEFIKLPMAIRNRSLTEMASAYVYTQRLEKLAETSAKLIDIVEGVRNERLACNGMRLKDTREWVEFYLAFAKVKEQPCQDK